MSKPVFKSNLQVLSKAYEGTPLQIIGKILTGSLDVSLDKTLLKGSEPAQENMSIISPYLTPIETIQWIRNMCTTEGSGYPFFLFGTVHSDDIKVASLESIIDKQPAFNNPFVLASVPVGYAEVLVAVVELPASFASEQPSPSESKSKPLGIPSPSVSVEQTTE